MIIGVITFWYSEDNYGQQLQMFALQEYLKQLGHTPYVIRYDNRFENQGINLRSKSFFIRIINAFFSPNKVIKNLYNRYIDRQYTAILKNNSRHFNQFRKEHITLSSVIYHSLDELKANPPEAEVYICGSDVIWKESVNCMAYFLDFGSDITKRIAFATSFGATSISENYKNIIKEKLQKFSLITVREKSGVDICQYSGYNNAYWVLDPSFLISVKTYKRLKKNNDKGAYCYLYLLGTQIGLSVRKILSQLKKHKTNVIYTASQRRIDKFPKEYATFEEWVEFISNAEFVVTNSFHGCAMSIIFHKNFLYIPIIGESSNLNDRVNSLCHRFGLEDRIFSKSLDFLYDEICWEVVDDVLEKDKNYAFSLLSDALNS